MAIKFILEYKIKDIEKQLGTKAIFNKQFNEYILTGVSEEKLLELGFEFCGYSLRTNNPMYRYENIEAIYEQQNLHIYEI